AELGDAVGVAIAVGVDEVAALTAHEGLVEAEALVEETLVGRHVPYVGVLLLRIPILQRGERDGLAVEKGFAALVGRLGRRRSVVRRRRDAAALAQMLCQQRTLLRGRELLQPQAGHQERPSGASSLRWRSSSSSLSSSMRSSRSAASAPLSGG